MEDETDDVTDRAQGAAGGGDQRMLDLEASVKRGREYVEELETQLDRMRAAKRQQLDLTSDNNNNNIEATVEPTTELLPATVAAKPAAVVTTAVVAAPAVHVLQTPAAPPTPEPPPRYVLSCMQASARLPNTPEGATWQQILAVSPFITMDDIGVAPDAMVIALAQYQLCLLTNDDRMGRYKHQVIGYVGICCKYCFGQPGYGRFFPSTSSSFVSSFPQTVVKHVSEDCLGTPRWLKQLVLKTKETQQRSDPTRSSHFGSKGLMERIWKVIRSSTAADVQNIPEDVVQKEERVLSIVVNDTDEHGLTWKDIIGQAPDRLVEISDQYLVPASLFVAVAQYEPCSANENDCRSIGRNRAGINPGYPGICCKHCQGHTPPVLPGARIFPAQAGSLSQMETCSKLQAHIEHNRCGKVPDGVIRVIHYLREKEKEDTRRYGSRKIFFQKVWNRLHGSEDTATVEPVPRTVVDDLPLRMELPGLVEGSVLVNLELDRGMVSDAHLVAFAQLKPCTLSKEDQIGWYKDRPLDFPGVCCKHCEGRPSSGRYFPKHGDFFLRSSKQSIIKHVIENCGQCPEDVRESLNELQRRDGRRKGWKITNQSVLGQGKLFHERIWRRLYTALGSKLPMPPEEPATSRAQSREPVDARVMQAENLEHSSGVSLDSNPLAATDAMVSTVGQGALKPGEQNLNTSTDYAAAQPVLHAMSESVPLGSIASTVAAHAVSATASTQDKMVPAVELVPQFKLPPVPITDPVPVQDVAEDYPSPGADRDHVNWDCLFWCRSLEEMLVLVRSAEFARIFQRLRLLHEDFLSKLRPLYPDEPLHGDTGFGAQHNWYAGWARRVRTGDPSACGLTLDRRAGRTVLFRLFDFWQDKSVVCDLNQRNEISQWITDILMLILPMERAACLYTMRNSKAEHHGMHWVSKLEEPDHPLLADVLQAGGKPAMNARFLPIQLAISCPDTLKVIRRLTVATECPREPITAKPVEFSIPNDALDNVNVVHPREEVLDRIEGAHLIDHFVFIYKSETFTNISRVLHTNPQGVLGEDIDMMLALYERISLCLQEVANLSVTKESVLKEFKTQSFTNVLEPIVSSGSHRKSKKYSTWPPFWLVELCETLDVLQQLGGETASV